MNEVGKIAFFLVACESRSSSNYRDSALSPLLALLKLGFGSGPVLDKVSHRLVTKPPSSGPTGVSSLSVSKASSLPITDSLRILLGEPGSGSSRLDWSNPNAGKADVFGFGK